MEENKRARQKERSHQRIVEVAARQFREDGLAGAGVQRIMEEAGLTHGGFYSHFGSKDDLVAEALGTAVSGQLDGLLAGLEDTPEPERLGRLVARYLSRRHRDAPGEGCPLPSISAEIARAPASVRRVYEAGLRETIVGIEAALADDAASASAEAAASASAEAAASASAEADTHARAVGALALCVGGLLLARAVNDSAFSDDILESCRRFVANTVEGEKE